LYLQHNVPAAKEGITAILERREFRKQKTPLNPDSDRACLDIRRSRLDLFIGINFGVDSASFLYKMAECSPEF